MGHHRVKESAKTDGSSVSTLLVLTVLFFCFFCLKMCRPRQAQNQDAADTSTDGNDDISTDLQLVLC